MEAPQFPPEVQEAAPALWKLWPHTLAERVSGGQWVAYLWLVYVSGIVQEAIAKGNQTVIIEAPPQHGKSMFISEWLPVWFLERWPSKRIILGSYAEGFASKWGGRVRDHFLDSEREGGLLTTRLRRDKGGDGEWETEEGGGMMCVGLQGGATGNPAELLVVDDPFKNFEEAMSEVIRDKIFNTYFSDFRSRVQKGGTIIILMTRRHEDDLIGRLKAQDKNIVSVTLPALAEDDDPLGRAPGAPLCPERYDRKTLESLKSHMPPMLWNALYQQRPSILGGNLFLQKNWRHWDLRILPKAFDQELISMDTAVEEGDDNDYTVIQHWGRTGPNFYLMAQVRGKWGMDQQLDNLLKFCKDRPKVVTKLIEKKTNGPAIQNLLKKHVSGIIMVEPMGSKYVRALAVQPYHIAGNIYVPEDDSLYPWVQDLKDEAANFPKSKKDDQVDTMTQAINYWEGGGLSYLDKITKE